MYFPRKSALALAVAATFAGGAFTTASAGTASSTYNTYATEAVSAGNVTNVANPNLAYQPNQVIAQNTSFTIYIKLNNGAKWNTGVTTSTIASAASYGKLAGSSASFNQSGNVLAITFNTGSKSLTQQNVFSLSQVSNLLKLSNASALETSGGKVTANFAFANGTASTVATYPSSPVDTASGTIAESQQAIHAHFVSSGNKGPFTSKPVNATAKETAQINVNASTPLSNVTNAITSNKVDFGAIYFTNTPGKQLTGSGNNKDYKFKSVTSSATITKVAAKISGNFLSKTGQEKLSLNSTYACTGGTTYASLTTPNSSSVNLSFNPTSSSLTAKTPVFVCMTVNTSNGTAQLPTTQPKISSLQLQNSSQTTVDTFSSGLLYDLDTNGAAINLINYVPAAAAPYKTYVRVANNSGVKAPITVTFTGQNGNKLGSGKLGTLAPSASNTYSANKLENAAGVTLSNNQRPQVLLTAPVPSSGTSKNTLTAQTYLGNGNGGFTNMTSDKTSNTVQ